MRYVLFVVSGWLLWAPSAMAGKVSCQSTSHKQVRMESWSNSGGAHPYRGMIVGTETWYYGKKVIAKIVHKYLLSPRTPPPIKVTWHAKTQRVLKTKRRRMVTLQTYTIDITIASTTKKRLHPKLRKGANRLSFKCVSMQMHGIP